MSDEDEKLLKAVREWRPPTKLHPIAMHAFHIYEEAGMSLPPDAMAKLKATLDAYLPDLVALAEALEGLTRFMMLVTEHHKDQPSGDKVMELLRSYGPLYEPFWERVGEAMRNVSAEQRGQFQSFMDSQTGAEKKAPTFGQDAPKNTVPLRNFVNPARPPPWAKKDNKPK